MVDLVAVDIDLAPNDHHIFLRKSLPDGTTINYYTVNLLHLSPYWSQKVPMLISDILQATPSKAVYNIDSFLLFKNHPIKLLTVYGRVKGDRLYEFENTSFYVLDLDDSSGESLVISVKVSKVVYEKLGLRLNESYGALVEVDVVNFKIYRNEPQLTAGGLTKLDDQDLWSEVNLWRECLATREKLHKCWEIPIRRLELERLNRVADVRFDERDLQRARRRQELHLTEFEDRVYTDVQARYEDRVFTDVQLYEDRASTDQDRYEDKAYTDAEDSIIILSERRPVNFQLDFPDVEILDDDPISIVTESQLLLEFVLWIVRRKFVKFHLRQLYTDHNIAVLLNSLVREQVPLDSLLNPKEIVTKEVFFHRIRHKLFNAGLIKVTKKQVVKLEKLETFYDDLVQQLLKVKRLQKDVQSRTSLSLATLDLNLGKPFVNGMIEYILVIHNDRSNWRYDPKSSGWVYIK